MKITHALSLLFVLVCFVMSGEAATCYKFCPDIYDPVCGTDGVTYYNKCNMICAGADLSHHGACGKKN
ncbi:hypothetical protein evm_010764 [Chilo suppressalis]|nr:hypothetical protein evm_010764 [Chilo suppressalis]